MTDDPLAIGPAELSKKIGVPEKTLERWRSKGEGPPYVKSGRHILYPLADLLSWLTPQARAS